jgi:capsular exopolysaccharide synthesis family protein
VPDHAAIIPSVDAEALAPAGDHAARCRTGLGEPAPHSGGPSLTVSPAELLRHKWLIIGVFVLIAALAIPPIWMFVIPTYSSTAVILVSPEGSAPGTQLGSMLTLFQSSLNTQVSLIRSPTILQRVLDRKDVRATHWYREEGKAFLGTPDSPLERLTDELQVGSGRDTHLISVTIETQKPGDAKLIVDAVVDDYMKYVEETSRLHGTEALERVKADLEMRRQTVDGLMKTRADLYDKLEMYPSEELSSQLAAYLTKLQAQKADLQREVRMQKRKLDQILGLDNGSATRPADAIGSATRPADTGLASTLPAGTGQDAVSQQRFEEDAEWRMRWQELEDARFELELAKERFGPAHWERKDLEAKVEHAQRRLAEREGQLVHAWSNRPVGTASSEWQAYGTDNPRRIESDILTKEFLIELLDEDIREQQAKADIAQQIQDIDRQISWERSQYEEVRSLLEELRMRVRAPGRSEVFSHGLTSTKPDKDRRFLLTALAIMAAAFTSLSVGYLRTRMDPKIREVQQVQRTVHVPFLGQIPMMREKDLPQALGGGWGGAVVSDGNGEGELVVQSCPPVMLERMRMIRTALLERLTRPGCHVIQLTSSLPRSGKTSMAVLLAHSLAILGKKVLLVEADMRRPVLGRRLGIETETGLAQVLNGKATDEEAVLQPAGLPFDLLLAEETHGDFNPELLANGVFTACLSRWKARYDFVLLDTPPVLPVADARILAGHAEGTIMVMRASHDSRPEVVEAHSLLAEAGSRLLGTVLIGGTLGTGRGGGYRYGYGYGYGDGYGYDYSPRT